MQIKTRFPFFPGALFRRWQAVVCLLWGAVLLHAETVVDAGRVREIAAMLPARPAGAGEPATNRTAWDALAKQPAFAAVIRAAETDLKTPMPETSDELYLEFSRNGNRTRWQNAAFKRRARLSTYALAECLENKGRFIAPLEQAVRDVSRERTWVLPAHDRSLNNFHGKETDIDLGSSALGWTLATADHLLGDKLSPQTRRLIRDQVQERIFTPFRDMAEGRRKENFWLRTHNNWNAVCLAGVAGAALALIEPPQERAWFAAASEQYVTNFLGGFTADGYCSEGMGYWNYGFGHFVLLTETLRRATGGRLDLFLNPASRNPSLFGRNAEILNGIYPSIADCHPGSRPSPLINCYAARRLNLTGDGCPSEVFIRPAGTLFETAVYAFMPEQLPAATSGIAPASPLRTWFQDGGVLICRPGAKTAAEFAVSLKGGHNAEHHNHNDVGSFIVVSGKSMVLADPGGEIYTARTFSGQRYESDVLNSFGHPVPVVAGQLQEKGAAARAVVLKTDFTDERDLLVLDLSAAYKVPGLLKLQRTFIYQRTGAPSLTVKDEAEFNAPKTFETALVSWAEPQGVSGNEWLFQEDGGGVKVRVETGGTAFTVRRDKLTADVSGSRKPLRTGITLAKPVQKAAVTLIITPDAAKTKPAAPAKIK